ncbi:hypothetical protein BOTBODRAFT_145937 [Botryobasidium botryosum FD-172 SS1]|uniref:SET domain-containing protein n=1 Tax=Botryobasidium botryosum (strain FD-172 SS1) TaxID=930990 RepID=A0A067MDW2_BOTB1|nr:hypothetical protein BOTBODRAFT_145937 [Botryobasidium botryosum FD-172 SS1]
MTSASQIDALLRWCAQTGLWIDPRLELRSVASDDIELASEPDQSLSSSLAVFAREVIDTRTVVARIPKSAVLSIRTSALSEFLTTDDYSHPDVNIPLSLALLGEIALGESSQWWGYIQSLPRDVVPIALLWLSDGGEDGAEARKWVQGTQVAALLEGQYSDTLSSLRDYFDVCVRPLIQNELKVDVTLAQFHYAYSLVSSRAFHVDAYHTIALVPIADAFNHVEEHNVHLESDYHVCATCGSLTECTHDTAPSNSSQDHRAPPATVSPIDDSCEMASNTLITPGQEVFNTYDSGLTNAKLLCQYGFLLDANENDVISWSMKDLEELAPMSDSMVAVWAQTMMSVRGDTPFSEPESDMVYHPSKKTSSLAWTDETLDDASESRTRDAPHQLLCVSADGAVSYHLWTYLVLAHSYSPEDSPLAFDVVQLYITAVADAHLRIESSLHEDRDEMQEAPELGDPGVLRILAQVTRGMIRLCQKKIQNMHLSHLSMSEWGVILDSTPAQRKRTKVAITYALNERSILETCLEGWRDFEQSLAVF